MLCSSGQSRRFLTDSISAKCRAASSEACLGRLRTALAMSEAHEEAEGAEEAEEAEEEEEAKAKAEEEGAKEDERLLGSVLKKVSSRGKAKLPRRCSLRAYSSSISTLRRVSSGTDGAVPGGEKGEEGLGGATAVLCAPQ